MLRRIPGAFTRAWLAASPPIADGLLTVGVSGDGAAPAATNFGG